MNPGLTQPPGSRLEGLTYNLSRLSEGGAGQVKGVKAGVAYRMSDGSMACLAD